MFHNPNPDQAHHTGSLPAQVGRLLVCVLLCAASLIVLGSTRSIHPHLQRTFDVFRRSSIHRGPEGPVESLESCADCRSYTLLPQFVSGIQTRQADISLQGQCVHILCLVDASSDSTVSRQIGFAYLRLHANASVSTCRATSMSPRLEACPYRRLVALHYPRWEACSNLHWMLESSQAHATCSYLDYPLTPLPHRVHGSSRCRGKLRRREVLPSHSTYFLLYDHLSCLSLNRKLRRSSVVTGEFYRVLALLRNAAFPVLFGLWLSAFLTRVRMRGVLHVRCARQPCQNAKTCDGGMYGSRVFNASDGGGAKPQSLEVHCCPDISPHTAASSGCQLLNTGGGDNRKRDSACVLHKSELYVFADTAHRDAICEYDWWTFLEYRSFSGRVTAGPGELLVRLPLHAVATKLLGFPLRKACREHGITSVRSAKKKVSDVVSLAHSHVCGPECNEVLAVLAPVIEPRTLPSLPVAAALVAAHTVAYDDKHTTRLYSDRTFAYVAHIRQTDDLLECLRLDRALVLCRLPLDSFVQHISARARREIASHHGVDGKTSPVLVNGLCKHVCSEGCQQMVTVLRADDGGATSEAAFPPAPLSGDSKAGIIAGFCNRMRGGDIEEAGCMVCGGLSLKKDLVARCDMPPWMDSLLTRPDVTAVERVTVDAPIRRIQGPVYAPGCRGVCPVCVDAISRQVVPLRALANGFWLGQVPRVLVDLSFAERMLIARSRHNRCVVRVMKSGMFKLAGNIISYPNPYPALYDVLPPHRDDLDELLAIVFTGAARPTDDDLKRVPFVVRRNRVRAALEWLKVNNRLYRDIQISEANLSSYADGEIPTIISWCKEEDNNPLESRSADDANCAVGTESGPCAFTVNGVAFDAVNPDNLGAIKAVAANHMINGKALAVPHGETPDTLWHNPDLFPCMFPWLFPYGMGGICNTAIQGRISEQTHKRHLLMYYNKRFQMDRDFALMAFNQEQITKGSMAGVFLSSKSKFQHLVDLITGIDRSVFSRLAERFQVEGNARPETDEEWACFKVLSELDMVNGHVPGSVATKRYERNELWSLLSYLGAPSWFITFAPADSKHSLCLYYAGADQAFDGARISLLDKDTKWRLIANNATASARFFHFIVQLFIEEILRWGKEGEGLFGDTNAYYGTVEQQGRLTLHLHVLIWIKSAVSPEEIRRRLLDPTSDFQLKMTQYLDSCHQGYLFESTLDAAILRRLSRSKEADYVSPVEIVPGVARTTSDDSDFAREVNDILSRTNAHTCNKRCWKIPGVKICKSRFPRKLIARTHVDDTGYIHVRHDELYMNSVNPVLTYLMRCNTDVTCLLSGTSIKAVIAYATDYITKVGLKTPSMFQLIRSQLDRHAALVDGPSDRIEKGRRLVVGIINSFTSKSEIGAPMAVSYLLDLPDHYKSHAFKVLYWRGFVAEVLASFHENLVGAEPDESESPLADYSVVVGHDAVVRDRIELIAVSPVQDYMFRPTEHGQFCLYDWIRLYVKSKRAPSGSNARDSSEAHPVSLKLGEGVRDSGRYELLTGHSQQKTHTIWMDNSRADVAINFVGGALPRRDSGDREYYCCTMLCLFKPWRSGRDLKSIETSWEAAFNSYLFSSRQEEVMGNFNLRYECLDARDDYSRRRGLNGTEGGDNGDAEIENENSDSYDQEEDSERDMDALMADLCNNPLGKARLRRSRMAADITRVLQIRGWTTTALGPRPLDFSSLPPIPRTTREIWASRLEAARVTTVASNLPAQTTASGSRAQSNSRGGQLRVVDRAYIDFLNRGMPIKAVAPDADELIRVLTAEFSLNAEQARAFTTAVGHHAHGSPDQLRMYVGGMAGTGKSRVIGAISAYFDRSGATDQLLLLAPTGTAAANIGGYTYHAALGLNHLKPACRSLSNSVRSLLEPVRYIIIDEVSMLSCLDMYTISAVLSLVHNQHSQPFGGFNVIFAGDFGQLPPVAGNKLYDSRVGMNGRKLDQQKSTMGRAMWLQVTQVVLLRQNMRQASASPADDAFRTALTNMRFKQCTQSDIEFLQSRVSGSSAVSLDDWNYRHVSVITGVNAHRDVINDLGCEKFAHDTGQTLTSFHSVNCVGDGEEDNWGAPRRRGAKRWLTTLKPSTRDMLWGLTHHATSNLPGVLKLCKGMPVLIRKNHATECGVTNGSEGVVVDWLARPILGGKLALEVVFVRLTAPNVRVQIEGLPPNVVPICAETVTTQCTLDDDTIITVRRQQVHLLPNFAMTDYASQGKTREYNVVDLHNIISHHGYYTALSRSAFALKTVILQYFDKRKVQGGLSSDLKGEFRDLEILDEITRLDVEKQLPLSVTSDMRYPRIAQFLQTRPPSYRPQYLHPALAWDDDYTHSLIFRDNGEDADEGGAAQPNRKTVRKRALRGQGQSPAITGVPPDAPRGFEWDKENFSCAYDALFTILYNAWVQQPIDMTVYLRRTSYPAALLCASFEQWKQNTMPFYKVRDLVRRHLHTRDSIKFPFGQVGTRILDVAEAVLNSNSPDWGFEITCANCTKSHRPVVKSACVILVPNFLNLESQLLTKARALIPQDTCCSRYEPAGVRVLGSPHCMVICGCEPLSRPTIDTTMEFGGSSWRLTGGIYHGNSHYVARHIDLQNRIWLHDVVLPGFGSVRFGGLFSRTPNRT